MFQWLFSVLDSAIVAATLLAALGWLLRNWISTRLTASIQLETDKKLHELKARIDAAEAQVVAVRDSGISANLQLSGVVVAERVAAVRKIWHGVIEWKRATMVITLAAATTAENVKKFGDDPGTRKVFEDLLDSFKHMELLARMNELEECRPFLGERAWALFAAYHGFYFSGVLRAVTITMDKEVALRIWTLNPELTIVRTIATPQLLKDYEVNPIAAMTLFLGWLQDELLNELRRTLAGEESGPEAAKQAAKIAAAVETLMAEANKAKTTGLVELAAM